MHFFHKQTPHLTRLNVLREVLVYPARIAQVHNLALRVCNVLLPLLKSVIVVNVTISVMAVCAVAITGCTVAVSVICWQTNTCILCHQKNNTFYRVGKKYPYQHPDPAL